MAKKKKRCTTGYSCGSSCISVTKECRVEFPTGVSVALDKKSASRNDGKPPAGQVEEDKTPRLKKDFNMVDAEPDKVMGKIQPADSFETEPKDGIYYIVDDDSRFIQGRLEGIIGANNGQVEEKAKNLLDNVWNGKVQAVTWEVEDEEEAEDPKGRLKQALIAKKMWKEEVFPKLEEGTIIINTPLGGPHGVRDRIYRKGGFGRVQDHGKNKQFFTYQYAMVVKGKLVPVEFGKPHVGYQKADISSEKLENWDFADAKFTKQDVIDVAEEVGVELEGVEWDLYLELLNEEVTDGE